MKGSIASIALICAVLQATFVSAANVIEDQGVAMSRDELQRAVSRWPANAQRAAADDVGQRFELLNMELASKKIAAEIENITRESNPEVYWQYHFALRALQRRVVVENFLKTLEVPDMTALAKERYLADKDKYALVPEERLSSHILISCAPVVCDREEKRPLAEEVLAKLRAGADFESLVQEYSEDPGSRNNAGLFGKWIALGEPHVVGPYVQALYEIQKVGDYSGVVETQFGFHIIRLDEIREQHYKPFEEVKDQIVEELVTEYKKLSAREFDRRYKLSDKAFIDGAAMDEIFAPYRSDAPVE